MKKPSRIDVQKAKALLRAKMPKPHIFTHTLFELRPLINKALAAGLSLDYVYERMRKGKVLLGISKKDLVEALAEFERRDYKQTAKEPKYGDKYNMKNNPVIAQVPREGRGPIDHINIVISRKLTNNRTFIPFQEFVKYLNANGIHVVFETNGGYFSSIRYCIDGKQYKGVSIRYPIQKLIQHGVEFDATYPIHPKLYRLMDDVRYDRLVLNKWN